MKNVNDSRSLVLLGPIFLVLVILIVSFADFVLGKIPVTVFVISVLCLTYLFIKTYGYLTRKTSEKNLFIFGWMGWIATFLYMIAWSVYQWYSPL